MEGVRKCFVCRCDSCCCMGAEFMEASWDYYSWGAYKSVAYMLYIGRQSWGDVGGEWCWCLWGHHSLFVLNVCMGDQVWFARHYSIRHLVCSETSKADGCWQVSVNEKIIAFSLLVLNYSYLTQIDECSMPVVNASLVNCCMLLYNLQWKMRSVYRFCIKYMLWMQWIPGGSYQIVLAGM